LETNFTGIPNLSREGYFSLCVLVPWCFKKDFFTTKAQRHEETLMFRIGDKTSALLA